MRVHLSILMDNLDLWAPGAELRDRLSGDLSFCEARMIYPGQNTFSPDVLYVLPDRALPPAHGENTLFLMCTPSDPGPVSSNVLTLLTCQSPEELCAHLSDFILRLSQWENQMNLAIIEGCSEQDLLNISEPFLRNPVILQDASFCYLAGTSQVGEVDEYYQKLKTGVDPTPEVVMSLIENRQAESEMKFGRFSTGQKYHIAVGPTKGRYKEIYVDLEQAGSTVMCVHMCLSHFPLSDGLMEVFGLFCDKLLKSFRLRTGDQSGGGVAINDYIFGRLIADGADALSIAQCDGIAPDQPYIIAAVEARATKAILKHINTVLIGNRGFLHQQQIYIYVPVDLGSDTSLRTPMRQEQQLCYFCERYHVRMGLSGHFLHLKDVGLAVAQAARTLSLLNRVVAEEGPKQVLVSYRDTALLDLVDCYRKDNPVESFAPPSYLRILEGDLKNNTNNCHVAEVFIANGCSVAQTAKQLFMHKNSVLYRIERIKTLYGLDFSNRQENQLFSLACLAAHLERAPAPPADADNATKNSRS